MTRHLVTCLAIIALSFISPTPAAAADVARSSAVYDTVDAVEIGAGSPSLIVVTGIISGQSAPTELIYSIINSSNSSIDGPARCDRLALLAMAKPGKFQFALNFIAQGTFENMFSCKLIARTP